MKKENEMVYVIKDEDGNFVSVNGAFTLTNEGWLYTTFTGRTTGFNYYDDWAVKIAKEELTKLQNLNNEYNFGKKFILAYINDLKKIKIGQIKIIPLIKNIDKKLAYAIK